MLVVRSLASGSSGNSFLLRTNKVTLLFDAGLPIAKLRKCLAGEALVPEQVSAVLLSHEHRDHCIGARDLAVMHGIPVWSNHQVLKAAGLHSLREAAIINIGQPVMYGDVEVTCFSVSHDSICPMGFLVRASERTVTIATDLGQPTDDVVEAIQMSDLVILEANHDLDMLHQGRYPYHLRRRVAGPTGHLSNSQAAGILAKNVRREDVDIWLAHLSKENNEPVLAAKTVQRGLKAAGMGRVNIGVAQRDRPSLRWTGVPRPRQLSLFDSAVIG